MQLEIPKTGQPKLDFEGAEYEWLESRDHDATGDAPNSNNVSTRHPRVQRSDDGIGCANHPRLNGKVNSYAGVSGLPFRILDTSLGQVDMKQ